MKLRLKANYGTLRRESEYCGLKANYSVIMMGLLFRDSRIKTKKKVTGA